MESGESSKGGNGQGGDTPPNDERIGIERPWMAPGLSPSEETAAPADFRGPGGTAASGVVGAAAGLAGTRSVPPDVAQAAAADLPSRFRPRSAAAGSSPASCQFLRSVGADGRLSEAQNMAVSTHRCAAFGDPLPLSLSQQELVCLQRAHVSCPRYVRGILLAGENQPAPAEVEHQSGRDSLLTLVGVGLVILAIGVFITTLLGLPPLAGGSQASQSPLAAASASRSAAASAEPIAAPTAQVTSSAAATAASTAAATAAGTARSTPTLAPTPAAGSSWPPGATASRMSRVVPCTGQANCYVYTVGPGDRLSFIADYFGVGLDAIWQLNPWLGGSGNIKVGDQLKIPPPTR